MYFTKRGKSKGIYFFFCKDGVCIVVAYYDSTSTVIVSLSPSVSLVCENATVVVQQQSSGIQKAGTGPGACGFCVSSLTRRYYSECITGADVWHPLFCVSSPRLHGDTSPSISLVWTYGNRVLFCGTDVCGRFCRCRL